MNIIHVITGLGDGGAEAVLYRLCANDRSYRHTVISLMDDDKYGPLLREIGVVVYCLNLRRGRFRFRALWQLWRLLRMIKPDVVQTWMYHADFLGGVAARLALIRKVFWGIRHTTLEPGKSSRATMFTVRLLAFFSWVVPYRIILCAHKAVLVHRALGYDTSRMRIIPNGYNLEEFVPNASARQQLRFDLAVSDDLPLLGMVGRFDAQKDHGNLLQALSILSKVERKFCFVLVGTGLSINNTQLVQQIHQAGLQDKVHLLGRRNDISTVMNALDVHVLSSSSEAFPNVLAEAMACGTPCVSTDVGDASIIVGDTGWLVPPCNPQALAEGIQAALRAKDDITAWSNRQLAARQRVVDNFSIHKMVSSYHKVWFASSKQTATMVS